MAQPDYGTTEHLSAEQVAGYIDDMLSAGEHARVEAHLSDCAMCRVEVAEAHRLVVSPPRVRHWSLLVPLTGALAAGLAAILLINTAGELSEAGDPQLRAAAPVAEADAALPGLAVHSPVGTVPRNRVSLSWSPAPPGSVYRVSVSTEGGTLVWAASTSDTILALPSGTVLQPGAHYFWHVDALLPDGRSASSGIRQFATRP